MTEKQERYLYRAAVITMGIFGEEIALLIVSALFRWEHAFGQTYTFGHWFILGNYLCLAILAILVLIDYFFKPEWLKPSEK